MALGVVILDLIVDKRKIVHQLDRDRPGHCGFGTAEEPAGVEAERGADAFAGGICRPPGLVFPPHHITTGSGELRPIATHRRPERGFERGKV
ncbi:MAG: hypothetical protein M5U18_00770 [Dehalococcoidia bacterium]|nr:hypothetical protein [Dehalococcoidia bacterium]